MLKPYENYKPSGIPWVSAVPKNWKVERLKFLAKVNPTKGNSKFEKDSNQQCVFLPMENVSEDGTFSNKAKQKITDVWSGYTYFERGDIVIAKITPCFENGKGAYLKNLETEIGFGTTEFHVLRPNEAKILPELLFLITRTNMFMKMGESLMRGSAGQQRVSTDFVENFRVWFPKSLPEQQAIVRFLDYKTEQIETFIQNRQVQIRLLREQRQSIIDKAIRFGIAADVNLIPRQDKFFKDIPAGWTLTNVRMEIMARNLEVQDGNHGELHPIAEEYVDEGIPFVLASDVNDFTVDLKRCKKITEQRATKLRIGFAKAGDVLLTHKGTIGRVGLCVTGENPYIVLTPQVTYYRFKRGFDQRFALYQFQSNVFQEQLKLLSSGGSTRDYVGIVAQRNLKLVKPPIDEQKAIVNQLDKETGRLDELMEKYKKQIGYMAEYKTALISQAVTGKIDVRDWQPPATRPTVRSRSNFTENVLVEEETP